MIEYANLMVEEYRNEMYTGKISYDEYEFKIYVLCERLGISEFDIKRA